MHFMTPPCCRCALVSNTPRSDESTVLWYTQKSHSLDSQSAAWDMPLRIGTGGPSIGAGWNKSHEVRLRRESIRVAYPVVMGTESSESFLKRAWLLLLPERAMYVVASCLVLQKA